MPLTSQHRTWLRHNLGARVQFDESMREHTSLRIGGPAEAYVTPHELDELVKVVKWSHRRQLPLLVIGNGTNLLVKDRGIKGIVINLAQGLNQIRMGAQHAGRTIVYARAGAKLNTLCRFALNMSLAGMNFALGIPGSVGGGICMNAGTSLGSVAKVLHCITILHPDGTIESYQRAQLTFGYRKLSWPVDKGFAQMKPPLIVEGGFALTAGDNAGLQREARQILQKRGATQPLERLNAGSFFKNPPNGQSAGELIERAGLKNKTIGGARISARHANFIINTGRASAADILALMELVQDTLNKKFNIFLEPEVKIVGE